MYGIEELEIPRLHREEVARELRRDSGRLLKLFQTARNVG